MSSASLDRPVRLVLHPGHPKCGSSSIQHELYSNLQRLNERGVFLPPRRPNRLFIEASERGQFATVEEWLHQLLDDVRRAGGDTLVISAENLGVRQLITKGAAIHEIFAEHCQPVDVIYYVRRQDDWMVSMWQQWGHKFGKSLTEFTEERLGYHEPGFLAAVRCFEGAYGSDRVVAVPLHRQALVGGDLVADFSHRAGLGPLPIEDRDRRRNASMGGFLCDVLARVPQVYDQALVSRVAEGRTDNSVRRLLERSLGSTDLLLNSDKRIMSVDLRRRVLGHFEDDNRALHERFFRETPFEAVFGLPAPAEDATLAVLRDEVAGLKDVIAIQMELILKLLRDAEEPARRPRASRRLKRWAKALRSSWRPWRRRRGAHDGARP